MIAAFFFVVDLIGIAVVHLEKNHTPAQSGVFFSSAALGAICVFTASRSVYVFSLWRSAGRLVLVLLWLMTRERERQRDTQREI